MTDETPKFLGATKDQFLVIAFGVFAMITLACVVLLALSISDNASAISASDRRASAAETQVAAARQIVAEDKTALCGIRRNAQDQVESTSNFLATHTDKTFFGGTISREQLIQSLHKQRAFRDTLVGLSC